MVFTAPTGISKLLGSLPVCRKRSNPTTNIHQLWWLNQISIWIHTWLRIEKYTKVTNHLLTEPAFNYFQVRQLACCTCVLLRFHEGFLGEWNVLGELGFPWQVSVTSNGIRDEQQTEKQGSTKTNSASKKKSATSDLCRCTSPNSLQNTKLYVNT